MEMKHRIKQNLKSPEHDINLSGFCIKDPLVSFFPDKIHRDTQGDSAHPSHKIGPLRE
jgi:hypothetical protein